MDSGGMYELIFVTQAGRMILHYCRDERQTLREQHPYETRMQTVCEAASQLLLSLLW